MVTLQMIFLFSPSRLEPSPVGPGTYPRVTNQNFVQQPMIRYGKETHTDRQSNDRLLPLDKNFEGTLECVVGGLSNK